MNNKINISYLLLDGDPSGRIRCTMATWTGIAYRLPRTDLEKCVDRTDMKFSGIYFLFGVDEESGDNVVYVGQADVRKNGAGILGRLNEHKRNMDKDYWTEAIVFTTSDDSLAATEISWLESYFCALAKTTNRYVVKNGNEPSPGTPREETIADLEIIAANIAMLMGVLGHKVFVPLVKSPHAEESSAEAGGYELHLHLKRKFKKSGLTIEADCKRTSEGFVVLAGSNIEKNDSESIPAGIKERRRTAKINVDGVLKENVLFNSPSYAAAFVIGGHVNGLTAWETPDGKTLKELEESGE